MSNKQRLEEIEYCHAYKHNLDIQFLISRVKTLTAALEKVLPHLKTSNDLPDAIHAVMLPYAQQLRNSADALEKRDSDIHFARQSLEDES